MGFPLSYARIMVYIWGSVKQILEHFENWRIVRELNSRWPFDQTSFPNWRNKPTFAYPPYAERQRIEL